MMQLGRTSALCDLEFWLCYCVWSYQHLDFPHMSRLHCIKMSTDLHRWFCELYCECSQHQAMGRMVNMCPLTKCDDIASEMNDI